jgi:hypothetical protein
MMIAPSLEAHHCNPWRLVFVNVATADPSLLLETYGGTA